MLKKRQSRRISSRKRHNLEKKNKIKAKKQLKLKKKENKLKLKLPKSVLLPDEDLELLKKIKEEEKARASQAQIREENEDFKRLVRENDLFLEILDVRDPLGSQSPHHQQYILEQGKEFYLILNNKENIPQERVDYWENYLKGSGFKIGSLNSVPQDKRIGIYGQKGVGKMFCYKQLNTPLVDKAFVRTEPVQPDFISLLRKTVPLKSLFYSQAFKDLLDNLNRDDFCLYFGIPYFESQKDLEAFMAKKFKIDPSKALNFILEEFYKGNLKFWRESAETKWINIK